MKNKQYFLLLSIYFSIIYAGSTYAANESVSSNSSGAIIPEGLENIWDPARYISLDEIKPGMDAYCLTEYGPDGIEKFGLDVIDVIRNHEVDRDEVAKDIILVKGTDERFIRTGPVAGCSGSPVYIQGRLAGALAETWTYSTEPLYIATPIEDMLGIDLSEQNINSVQTALNYDFTIPINFTEINNNHRKVLTRLIQNVSGMNPLPCPLITSGISTRALEQLQVIAEPLGLMVVAGIGNSGGNPGENENIQLVPGASLGIPLVSGDIKLSTMGTVTEVIGDKVYGFGHMLLGFGQIDLPMATGKVHTVVSNLTTSFKMASILETVGALKIDKSKGVIGYIGAEPKTIPLTIRIDHCNDSQIRTYNCQLASNELVTPSYLQLALSGAALQSSELPLEHTIEYKFNIGIENDEVISSKNISTDSGLNEMLSECVAVVTLLMDNPYRKLDIEYIECEIKIKPQNISSNIWSVDLSSSKARAGETIEVGVIVESYLGGKKKYRQSLEIPKNLKPGTYELSVCGSQAYEQFLTKATPHKFVAKSIPELIEALHNVLGISRDRLYFILVLPTSGITLEKAELPDLAATKTIILQDKKRGLNIKPYQHWIEKSIYTGAVIANQKVMRITVEE